MTPDVHQLSHRIARDYLIDQLVPASIGLPRPQLDLPFEAELPKVAYGQKAHFFLSFSQKGVRYRLKAAGQWLGDWQAGTGATIAFYSDPMAEDLQFEMWAEKALPDQQLFRLYTLVFVQVGIDNTLPVSLDPVLIPYMETTSIRIERTQEGVMYEAYALDAQGNYQLITAKKEGNNQVLVLTTSQLSEDVPIWVKAIKEFDPIIDESQPPDPQTGEPHMIIPPPEVEWLRDKPVILVEPDLRVRFQAREPLTFYGQPAVMEVAAYQTSAEYQLYSRPILDQDFIHFVAYPDPPVASPYPLPEAKLLINQSQLQGTKNLLVQAYMPYDLENWSQIADFQVESAFQAGDGIAPIVFDIAALQEDRLYLMLARKRQNQSQRWLLHGGIALVKPKNDLPISLETLEDGSRVVRIQHTEPGVYYYLRKQSDNSVASKLYYRQKQSEQIDNQPKGIGELKIEVDFFMFPFDTDTLDIPAPNPNSSQVYQIVAYKGQTLAKAIENQTVTIDPLASA